MGISISIQELFKQCVCNPLFDSDFYILKEAKLANRSIPGDALLLAAVVTYLGPFGPDVRQELLQKWHKLCLDGAINMKLEDPRATVFIDVPLATCDHYVAIPVSKTFQIALNRILGLDLHRIHGDSTDLVQSVLLWGHRFAWAQRCPLLADHHKHEEPSSQTSFPPGQYDSLHLYILHTKKQNGPK